MLAGRSFNIKTDAIDTRDYIYRPSLRVLAPRFLCAVLDSTVERDNRTLRIRDQRQRSTCVGEALAALIDIQRYENGARSMKGEATVSFVPTSAAMLDGMARSIEMGEAGATAGVLSLRSALRGFYNCGVATQADWPDDSAMTFDRITDSIAESARQLGLGAYYRLENVLNDWHAALHEAGAILVSASIHDGWAAPPQGVIGIGPAGAATLHAFVVVGYTEDGFLVLNSFGPQWGGYSFDGATPLPGVALWSYEDWAGSVRDAWVLRLAVPTPAAFRFTVGAYGKSAERGATITRSDAPRRNAVIGRYLTFEEGRFNDSGVYPTTRATVETTRTIKPRSASNRAATHPSPPLLPGPHSTAIRDPGGTIFAASSATARPAFSIKVRVGTPLAAARRSASAISAVVSNSKPVLCDVIARPSFRPDRPIARPGSGRDHADRPT